MTGHSLEYVAAVMGALAAVSERVRGRRYLVQNAADAVRCRGEKGKAGGGLKVVKKLDASGEPIRGDREIIPEEAEIACYIFREFASAKARRPSLSI